MNERKEAMNLEQQNNRHLGGRNVTCPSFLGGPFDHNVKKLANVAF